MSGTDDSKSIRQKQKCQVAAVIKLVTAKNIHAKVEKCLTRLGFTAPTFLGAVEDEDDFEQLLLIDNDELAVMEGAQKVHKYCKTVCFEAKMRGVNPHFREAEPICRQTEEESDLDSDDSEDEFSDPHPVGVGKTVQKEKNQKAADDFAWEVALRYREVAGIFRTAGRIGLPDEKTKKTLMDGLRARYKSDTSIKAAAKFADQYADYVLHLREENEKVPLSGKDATVALTGFLELVRERGQSVPHAAKSALTVWGEATRTKLPLTEKEVVFAARKDREREQKRAPPLQVEFIKMMENIATDENSEWGRRNFAASILLMVFASLRFSDVQRLKSLHITRNTIHGKLLDSKTKVGAEEPWACPKMGITTDKWVIPIGEVRETIKHHINGDGKYPNFLFMWCAPDWTQVKNLKAQYHWVKERMENMAKGAGWTGEMPTLHSMKGWAPTVATQLGLDWEARCKLGHWTQQSNMPRIYDKSVCAEELKARDKVMRAIRKGFVPAKSFEIPPQDPDALGLGSMVHGHPSHPHEGSQRVKRKLGGGGDSGASAHEGGTESTSSESETEKKETLQPRQEGKNPEAPKEPEKTDQGARAASQGDSEEVKTTHPVPQPARGEGEGPETVHKKTGEGKAPPSSRGSTPGNKEDPKEGADQKMVEKEGLGNPHQQGDSEKSRARAESPQSGATSASPRRGVQALAVAKKRLAKKGQGEEGTKGAPPKTTRKGEGSSTQRAKSSGKAGKGRANPAPKTPGEAGEGQKAQKRQERTGSQPEEAPPQKKGRGEE